MSSTHREPHAALDVASRRKKAEKIDRLLGLTAEHGPFRLLEIGTGSGVIAHHFASHPRLECLVSAVDVVDQRVIIDGYDFELVEDTALPFSDGIFDVVLTNHVIEHVGTERDQFDHLMEIQRVMAEDGVGYLATPNRWAVIEPHYRLPLLSWLPGSLRSRYVRLAKRGETYDCEPLSVRELERLLDRVGLDFQHLETQALVATLGANHALPGFGGFVAALPDRVRGAGRHLAPTMICRLTRQPT